MSDLNIGVQKFCYCCARHHPGSTPGKEIKDSRGVVRWCCLVAIEARKRVKIGGRAGGKYANNPADSSNVKVSSGALNAARAPE